MSIKRMFVMVSVIAVLLVSASAIYAQGPDGGRGGRGGRGPRGPVGDGAGRFVGGFMLVQEIADVTNTLPEDVLQARQDGQSFSDYVTANGGDPAAVVTEVLDDMKLRLDRAVENERLTQEEADELLATAETELNEAMTSTDPIELPARGGRGDHFQAVQIISDAIGLDPMDIAQEIRDGKTLAEIITENGGDVDTVKAELIANATERINQAVEDGKLTQEEADEMLANLDTTIDDLLSGDLREMRMDGRGGRGGRWNDDADTEAEVTEEATAEPAG